MKFIMVFFCLSCFANEIELFRDWDPFAKGEEPFPLIANEEEEALPLLPRLRRRLEAIGWKIRSWEREAYRPWLLKHQEVGSWEDLLHWIGIGLPRPQAMLPSTRYWIFWSLGPTLRHFDFSFVPKEKLILFMWEPPVVQPESHDRAIHACFGKIFTWDDDLIDGVKYFKFHYPVRRPRIADVPPFEEKQFCTMINSRLSSKHPKELYSERERVIRFFEDKEGQFDLYGKYWEKRNYKNYRGVIGDKIAVLKNYKFCIAYENTKDVRGYVTEKIFDCFCAGVVPVYLGASNICNYVPKDCFVDRRDFASDEALYAYLSSMTKDTYMHYLNRANAFLQSKEASLFTEAHFIDNFIQHVCQIEH